MTIKNLQRLNLEWLTLEWLTFIEDIGCYQPLRMRISFLILKKTEDAVKQTAVLPMFMIGW